MVRNDFKVLKQGLKWLSVGKRGLNLQRGFLRNVDVFFVLHLCIFLVCRSQLDIRRGERHCSPPAIIRVNRLGIRDVG